MHITDTHTSIKTMQFPIIRITVVRGTLHEKDQNLDTFSEENFFDLCHQNYNYNFLQRLITINCSKMYDIIMNFYSLLNLNKLCDIK